MTGEWGSKMTGGISDDGGVGISDDRGGDLR